MCRSCNPDVSPYPKPPTVSQNIAAFSTSSSVRLPSLDSAISTTFSMLSCIDPTKSAVPFWMLRPTRCSSRHSTHVVCSLSLPCSGSSGRCQQSKTLNTFRTRCSHFVVRSHSCHVHSPSGSVRHLSQVLIVLDVHHLDSVTAEAYTAVTPSRHLISMRCTHDLFLTDLAIQGCRSCFNLKPWNFNFGTCDPENL